MIPVSSEPTRLFRKMSQRLVRRVYLDLGRGPQSTVLVAGSGRSGTTWLANILNHHNRYRYVFEPFHPGRTAPAFAPRQYITPSDRDSGFLIPARAILSGRVRNRWADQYNRKLVARERLVKDIWSNLMLGWLHSSFPDLRMVLILRHPCAVVDSQMRFSGWDWYVDPSHLLGQKDLMEDHLEPFRELLAGARSDVERHAVTWCVENLVPLRQLSAGQVHVVLYEHLVTLPEAELADLLGFLGQAWDPRALAGVRTPSAVSGNDRLVQNPVEGWTNELPGEATRRILEIAKLFGLDRLYGDEPMPRLRGSEVLPVSTTRASRPASGSTVDSSASPNPKNQR
jgi:hypothetical protein